MKNTIQQCAQAYLNKKLKISKTGKPYIETKSGKINCKGQLVCFIRLPVPKKMKSTTKQIRKRKKSSTKKLKRK